MNRYIHRAFTPVAHIYRPPDPSPPQNYASQAQRKIRLFNAFPSGPRSGELGAGSLRSIILRGLGSSLPMRRVREYVQSPLTLILGRVSPQITCYVNCGLSCPGFWGPSPRAQQDLAIRETGSAPWIQTSSGISQLPAPTRRIMLLKGNIRKTLFNASPSERRFRNLRLRNIILRRTWIRGSVYIWATGGTRWMYVPVHIYIYLWVRTEG